jgi:DNA-directed RNA polymerase I, II, and III subunit RPABC2
MEDEAFNPTTPRSEDEGSIDGLEEVGDDELTQGMSTDGEQSVNEFTDGEDTDEDSDDDDAPSTAQPKSPAPTDMNEDVMKLKAELEIGDDALVSSDSDSLSDGDASDEYDSDDSDYDSEDDVNYEKFNEHTKKDVLSNYHSEIIQDNYEHIMLHTAIVRDDDGNIVDDLHRTIPFLSKYERARVLGMRAKQINSGGDPFIDVPTHIIDGHVIAEMELEKKSIPFIIMRPMPNGKKEYWKLSDLELLDY